MPADKKSDVKLYTVKQVSEFAGVSVRTLHYYDELGLLMPVQIGANSYRYYDDAALLKLQQILFYREIGFELNQIKEILSAPDFDLLNALKTHRSAIQEKRTRMDQLIETIDETIRHLDGERREANTMTKKNLFKGFTEEEEAHYTRLARLEYGPRLVDELVKRWNGYSKDQQQAIMDEANMIYSQIAELMNTGISPQNAEVQLLISAWHENIRHFYEPTLEIMRGLAQTYSMSPEFAANFQKIHADLPAYLTEAITHYVDDLETAEIAQMLTDDEANSPQH